MGWKIRRRDAITKRFRVIPIEYAVKPMRALALQGSASAP